MEEESYLFDLLHLVLSCGLSTNLTSPSLALVNQGRVTRLLSPQSSPLDTLLGLFDMSLTRVILCLERDE